MYMCECGKLETVFVYIPPHRLNTISIELPTSQHVACGLCGSIFCCSGLLLEIVFPLHISSRKVLKEKSLAVCVSWRV